MRTRAPQDVRSSSKKVARRARVTECMHEFLAQPCAQACRAMAFLWADHPKSGYGSRQRRRARRASDAAAGSCGASSKKKAKVVKEEWDDAWWGESWNNEGWGYDLEEAQLKVEACARNMSSMFRQWHPFGQAWNSVTHGTSSSHAAGDLTRAEPEAAEALQTYGVTSARFLKNRRDKRGVDEEVIPQWMRS